MQDNILLDKLVYEVRHIAPDPLYPIRLPDNPHHRRLWMFDVYRTCKTHQGDFHYVIRHELIHTILMFHLTRITHTVGTYSVGNLFAV